MLVQEFNTMARAIMILYDKDAYTLGRACGDLVRLSDSFMADNPYTAGTEEAVFQARMGLYVRAYAKKEIEPDVLYYSAHSIADVIKDEDARNRALVRFDNFKPESTNHDFMMGL